jgi:glycine oxidase
MNVAIVGAGLVGRLLAWQMLENGHTVSLYDKDNGDGAQSAGIIAAAMLAPYSELLDSESVVYEQGLQGFSVWQAWEKQLLEVTGIDIALQLNGSIVVAHRNDEGDYQRLLKRISAHNVINQNNVQNLDKVGLSAIEPELIQSFDKALFLTEEGCLDNHALFKALAFRITELGGNWHETQPINVIDESQWQHFDKVIDSRGFGAANDLQDLRGVRGEVIRVHAPEVNLSRPVRLMHPRYKLYIAPKPNNEYIIGATQIESSSEHAVTVRSSMELLSALYSVHTGFSEASVLSQSARCRPAFSHNLPKIIIKNKRVIINGLYRHGYLLSPMVISQVLYELGINKENIWPDIVFDENKLKEEVSI